MIRKQRGEAVSFAVQLAGKESIGEWSAKEGKEISVAPFWNNLLSWLFENIKGSGS